MSEDYCSYSPDEILGVNFSSACYNHDRQYRNEVKKRLTRKQADENLRDEIKGIFDKNNMHFIGFIVGNLYYLGVRLFGASSWDS